MQIETPQGRRMKRTLLYLLIGSIACSALLTIVIVLFNSWGWFETRVVLSTLLVAGASLMGLACDVSRSRTGANLLPRAGMLLTFLTLGLILAGMWFEVGSALHWKTMMIVGAFAVATVHVSLLSVARLSPRFQWVFWGACLIIFALALLICHLVVFEVNFGGVYRLVLVLTILVAAVTLTIPILHRISSSEGAPPVLLRGGMLGGGLSGEVSQDLAVIDLEILGLQKRIAQLELQRDAIASDLPLKAGGNPFKAG